MQSLKKIFSLFVTLTTILWSVGAGALAFPSVASAATLSTGDLIKASGPAVYYYAADGKRYVFPHEKMFFSWFKDFSSVKTITDAELAAISIGGNVTERPGTKLVKITTDPKTYAVTQGGILHWVQSEAIAKALYGDNWNQRIIDVSDAFFVNYTVGSSVATNVHPDGTLIQYAGDTNTYVVMSGVKRKFAAGAFDANGFNTANIITTTIAYGNGADVTGRESVLADVVVTTGGGTTVGGALSVALASDTPAGMNVPKNSSSVALIKVNFTAGSSDATITSLHFHRVGVGATSDFANVYLYDGSGLRLTTGRSINTTTNIVEFNNLSVKAAAGQTASVYVYGDFSTPTATGGQHAFELVDAASVVVSAGTVSGSFPVRGNVFTVGTTSAARVDILKGTQPANPTIGSKQVEISNFKLQANGTDDIDLRQITLYQAGSVTNSDLQNFNLYQGTTIVATAAAVSSNGHVVLKFSPSFTIPNGTTRVFSLKADVGGRASRTIKLYVEYTTDVTAIDKTYSAGAAVCINNSGACSAYSGGATGFDGTGGTGVSPQTDGSFIEVLTQGGQLTNAFNGPATSNVAKGQLGVSLYKFALTSPDNTLEIKKIVFTLQKVSGTPQQCSLRGAASTPTLYFRSIKIKNMDTGATMMGPTELSSTGSTSTQALTYTDSFNITAGQTMNLALVADLANTEDTAGDFFTNGNCQFQAVFSAFGSSDVRVVDTGEFLSTSKIVPNTAVTGNALTIKSSGLDVNLASTPVSGTLVKKAQNVPIAGVTLSASAQSDITVTSLTFRGQANIAGGGYTAADFATRVTSIALYDGDTQIGLAHAPDTTTADAQITNMNLLIPKGTTKSLTVKATLASSASTGATKDVISLGISAASAIQAQDQDSNTVTPTLNTVLNSGISGQLTAAPSVKQTILNSGTITVQADSNPVSNIVIAGKDAWVNMAQYKATAQYEAVDLDRIAVFASSTLGSAAADNADYAAIAIASAGAVKGSDTLSSGATGTRDIDLSTNKITVPKDGSIQFQIWAKFANVQASSTVGGVSTGVSRSGAAPALGVSSGTQTGEWDSNYMGMLNIRAIGSASGERVYAAAGAAFGNAMALRKSQPIVTKQSLSSTTLANIDEDLLKFQVAADSAGSIAWKQVIFSYAKTSKTALANFRLRKGATDLDTALYAITNATTSADLVTGSIAAGVNSGTIIVSLKPGQEESISGSGNVYTLHATVSGATSGENVSLSFVRESDTSSIVTGYLANFGMGSYTTSTNNYSIDKSAAPLAAGAATGTAVFAGTFVWSDNSEVPHSQLTGIAGGSRDWINDLYVQDLSQTQTLSL